MWTVRARGLDVGLFVGPFLIDGPGGRLRLERVEHELALDEGAVHLDLLVENEAAEIGTLGDAARDLGALFRPHVCEAGLHALVHADDRKTVLVVLDAAVIVVLAHVATAAHERERTVLADRDEQHDQVA